jgi:hypothetical protein
MIVLAKHIKEAEDNSELFETCNCCGSIIYGVRKGDNPIIHKAFLTQEKIMNRFFCYNCRELMDGPKDGRG